MDSEKKALLQDPTHQQDNLKQIVYSLSHDLQAPLRNLTSYLELLEEEYADQLGEEGNFYVERSLISIQGMNAMINDLLAYSRITGDTPNKNSVDLNEVIQEVMANLKDSILESQAQISFSNLPEIQADKRQVVHLFQHLISNAIRFRNKDILPQIAIAYAIQENTHEFTVADNGIGIDLRFKDQVFGIFQRLHHVNAYPDGTGIGLAICKRIVELHGGQIEVRSKLGEGCQFVFNLGPE